MFLNDVKEVIQVTEIILTNIFLQRDWMIIRGGDIKIKVLAVYTLTRGFLVLSDLTYYMSLISLRNTCIFATSSSRGFAVQCRPLTSQGSVDL